MKIIGGLMFLLGYLLIASGFVVWGVHWVYNLTTTDVNFFVALFHSFTGFVIQIIISLVLLISGGLMVSNDEVKKKTNWK